MLQITDQAATVFQQVVQAERPDGGAIRIGTSASPDGQPAIQFGVVPGPSEGDVPAEAPGIDVFVSPELAAPLDEAIVDARQSEQGTELFVRPQQTQG